MKAKRRQMVVETVEGGESLIPKPGFGVGVCMQNEGFLLSV